MNAPARMTGAERMAKHRANLRAKGYKLKQYWLPDLNDPKMQADIKRGIAAINASDDEAEVMAFAALNFEEIMANEPEYDWGPAGPPEGSNPNA